jgi:hypothetical protein
MYSGVLQCYDEGRGLGVVGLLGVDQVRIIVGNEEANEEDRSDVELELGFSEQLFF